MADPVKARRRGTGLTFGTEVLEGLRIALNSIRVNKLRSSLTTLGVVIGIVTVTLMGTAIEGIQQSFKTAIATLGTDVLYIQRFSWFVREPWWKIRSRRDILIAHAKAIERQSTMATVVTVEAYSRQTIRRNGRSASGVTIVGVDEKNFQARGFSISTGRMFTESEVDGSRPLCVLGADIAKNFFRGENPIGGKVFVGGVSFEVIGVMAPFDKFLGLGNDNQILIAISQLQTHFRRKPDVQILVKIRDVTKLDDAREELRGIMRKARRLEPGDADDFGVNAQEALLKQFNTVGGTLAAAGLGITSLSLFVGGIGIMNIMFVSVAERTREIGVRKAIGARKRTILIQFLIEAALVCLFGGLLGLGIAFAITLAMTEKLGTTMSPMVAFIALGVSVLTGVVSGFLPAWRAANMNPVDALRSE